MSSHRQELPVDLVADVLSRLEVKHLVRCKLISKTICNLIRSPRFAYEHLYQSRRSKSNCRNIVFGVNKFRPVRSSSAVYLLSPESEVHMPPLVRSADIISLMGSCNGLLLIQLYFRPDNYSLMLCNPTTIEYRILPIPFSSMESPWGRDGRFGLGYDALSGDYKVIRIPYRSPCKKPFVAEVWTRSTNHWTKIDFLLPNLSSDEGYLITSCSAGLLVNGNLYWSARPYNRGPRDGGEILLSISLADYAFRQITISDVTAQYDDPGKYLMEFTGSPAMVVYEFNPLAITQYDIWVLEGTKGNITWAKRLSIGPFPRGVAPTRLCLNGNIVMRDSSKRSTDKFFLYDPCTKEEKQLPRESSLKHNSIMLWSVDESIVSVY